MRLQPDSPTIYIKRAREMEDEIFEKEFKNCKKSDFDLTINNFTKAIERDTLNYNLYQDRGELYLQREQIYKKKDDFHKACKDIETYLKLYPEDNFDHLAGLSNMFVNISLQQRVQYFSAMIAVLPENEQAYWLICYLLAKAYANNEDSIKALSLYAQMIEKNNKGSAWQLLGYSGRASLYGFQGEYDKALDDYAAIVRL
jgi:tetratricopeptide (TPR) repeat protein